MSVVLKLRTAGLFPLITCDGCNREFDDWREVNVLYHFNPDGATPDTARAWFAHKGTCSFNVSARIMPSAVVPQVAWMPYPVFLRFLAHNTGIASPSDWRAFLRSAREWGATFNAIAASR